jgi:hypothetical protein
LTKYFFVGRTGVVSIHRLASKQFFYSETVAGAENKAADVGIVGFITIAFADVHFSLWVV